MKGLELIKRLVVIVLAVLIFAVAFLGVYAKEKGVWIAKLKGYNYGMDFSGYRELKFVLDDSEATEKEYYVDDNGNIMGEVASDESSLTSSEINLVDEDGNPIETDDANADDESAEDKEDDPTSAYKIEKRMVSPNPVEARTPANYENTKKIVQKRLEKINGYEYNIRVDNETGDIVLEVPDDEENILLQKSIMTTKGNLKIVDSQNGLILLDSDKIQSATAIQGPDSESGNGYQMYVTIQYKKEAIETLREISTKYVKEETSEDEDDISSSEEEKIKTVKIMLDDTNLRETYFGDELKDGAISIPVGEAYTDYSKFEEVRNQVVAMANAINGESLPLEYELSSDTFIKSAITENTRRNIKIAFAIVVIAISAALIVRYKMRGLIAAALGITYAGALSLLIRYTNVYVTFNSACTYALAIVMNYYLLLKILEYSKNDEIKDHFARAIKEYYLMTIPVWIVGLIFTFAYGIAISSIGMVTFWGMFLQLVGIGITYALDLI